MPPVRGKKDDRFCSLLGVHLIVSVEGEFYVLYQKTELAFVFVCV